MPQSMTHGWCNAKPTITFPIMEHCSCLLADTHFPIQLIG